MKDAGRALLLVAALAACGHEDPFLPGLYTPEGPYAGGDPLRLTFDLEADSTPTWLADGSAILYSFGRLDRPDGDRCLGLVPAGGGSRRIAFCNTSPAGDDSTDIYTSPALSPGGRLAYFRSTLRAARPARTFVGIGIGTLAAPEAGPLLDNLPGGFAAGLAETATRIHWLSDSDFVYVAVSLPAPLDPSRPLAVVRARLRADSAVYEILAGTDSATCVTAVGDTIYYARRNDSRVYRRALSIDSTDVVHAFGAGETPIAVAVAGSRLAAITSGSPSQVWLVDLNSGSETVIPAPGNLLDLALAPAGDRLVLVVAAGGNIDLWKVTLP